MARPGSLVPTNYWAGPTRLGHLLGRADSARLVIWPGRFGPTVSTGGLTRPAKIKGQAGPAHLRMFRAGPAWPFK